MHTDNFRRQHADARARVGAIEEALAAPVLNADRVSNLLIKLGGLLRIHFAMEDRSLYPAMLASSSCEAAQTARIYQDEMGGIWPTLSAFVDR